MLLPRARSLCLQIQQDKASPGPIGHADRNGFATRGRSEARLDDERYAVGCNLPGDVIGQPPVGQGGLRPPAEEVANVRVFGCEVACRCFDHGTVDFGP